MDSGIMAFSSLVLVLCRCDDASLTCRNRLHAGSGGIGVFATEFSRLVFLESRIASRVASISGELEREAGGPRPPLRQRLLRAQNTPRRRLLALRWAAVLGRAAKLS
jgi:hypothetical protein